MQKIRNVRVSEEMADILNGVSEEEWAYFDYMQDVSDQIAHYMDKHGVTKAELARRMDTSKAFVTKVLRGDANMTFKTFIKVLHALGAAPQTRVAPKDDRIQWFGVVKGRFDQQRRRGLGASWKSPSRPVEFASYVDENQTACV